MATKLEHPDEKRKTICGTPNYIAPEVIQGDKATRGHSFEVDIWSMGVILFTVLVGKPPYEAKDVKATYQRIIANEYSFPSHVPVSENAKNLIVSMLQSKPEDRYVLSFFAGCFLFSCWLLYLQSDLTLLVFIRSRLLQTHFGAHFQPRFLGGTHASYIYPDQRHTCCARVVDEWLWRDCGDECAGGQEIFCFLGFQKACSSSGIVGTACAWATGSQY